MRDEYDFSRHQAISTNEYSKRNFKMKLKTDEWTYEGRENAATAQKLREGHTCKVVGFGQSMVPILKSGQPVICVPVDSQTELNKNDIVMCKVNGHYYLHKIVAIRPGDRFVIGNNHGHINGTIGRNNIFGLVIKKL